VAVVRADIHRDRGPGVRSDDRGQGRVVLKRPFVAVAVVFDEANTWPVDVWYTDEGPEIVVVGVGLMVTTFVIVLE